MTEDEAFIRAVVDNPGEDTPRGAYADWLDEHDDPRGPYLRAEFEWAMPWRNGERPTDNLALRERAARLDPMWVARISRPPMGVCCEHIRFEGGGQIGRGFRDATIESESKAAALKYRHQAPIFLDYE